MMTEQQLYEQIEAYLLDELSQEERFDLETRIRIDPILARKVTQYRHLMEVVTDQEVIEFRRQIEAIQTRLDAARIANRRGISRLQRRLALAAGLALMLSVGAWFYFSYLRPPSAAMAVFQLAEKEAYLIYPKIILAEGNRAGSVVQDEYSEWYGSIEQAYAAEDYPTALRLLLQEPAAEAVLGKDRYFYYRGLLELRSGKVAAAAASLEQVTSAPLVDVARWNRAFALVAGGRIDEARKQFSQFVQENYQAEKAGQMLQQLEGM